MIEVAIVSMEEALRADGEAVPAGAAPLARAPLDLPGVGGTGEPDPRGADTISVANPLGGAVSLAADAHAVEASREPKPTAVPPRTGA
jgi:hypothetical protein